MLPGEPDGLTVAGYRAIDSMRLEKGYRVWGSDLTGETNPYEAGLGFCVKLDKPGGFVGRDALAAAQGRRADPTAACDRARRPDAVGARQRAGALGREIVGRVTSGGFGYTLGASIALAYLPVELGPGSEVAIDLFGTWIGGTVHREPLFDPRGERVHA